MVMMLAEGSTMEFNWAAQEGQKKGFLPSAELQGKATIEFKKDDPQAPPTLRDLGFGMTLKDVRFKGLKINKSDGIPMPDGAEMGVRNLDMGEWGGSESGADRLLNYPLMFDKPTFGYDAKKTSGPEPENQH